jgi:dipeptidyl aminopeptidase/acylaminoacyl peptidase
MTVSLMSAARRLGMAILCLELALSPGPAAARAFTLDDLLRSEAFGAVGLAPGGRRLVAQTFAPYDSAPRFDFGGYAEPALGRLTLIDLASPGRARRLGGGSGGGGYTPGPFSPSGRAMVIFRLRRRGWNTGVVDLQSGRIRWLGLSADQPLWGRSVQWRSERELVMIALDRGEAPQRLRSGWQAKERLVRLWRRTAAGRRPAVSLVGSGRFAALTPTPPTRRLVSIDLRSGAVRTLARGGFFDIELSADGRYLAAISNEAILAPAQDEPLRIGAAARERRLTLVELSTGKVSQPLGPLDVMSHLLSWNPGDDRLLIYARAAGQAWPKGHLISLDARSAIASPLASAGVKPEVGYTSDGIAVVRAGWLEGSPLVYGRKPGPAAAGDPGAGGRADWFWLGPAGPVNLSAGLSEAPARPLAVSDQGLVLIAGGAAWRVSPHDRARRLTGDVALRPLPGGSFGEGDRFAVNPDLGQGPALAAGSGQLVWIFRDGEVRSMALAPEREPLALTGYGLVSRRTDADGVQRIELSEPGAPAFPLISLNRGLAGVARARILEVDHSGPGKAALKSWLYLPAGAAPPRGWPLIVLPYPGAVFADPPKLEAPGSPGFAPDPQILTAHGYGVLLPSLPRDRQVGEPAKGLADQIGEAVDASLAQGGLDPSRIALWGHSFGGYAALVTATQSTRYRAIIAASAPSDLAGVWGAPPAHNRVITEDGYPTNVMMGWVESGQASLGGPPWSDPQRYVRNSPLFAAGAVTTPLFLIYGDEDFVPASQGEAMFAALYRQDKDAVLMRLWGEGHTPASPANIRALYQAVFGWLDKVLAAP